MTKRKITRRQALAGGLGSLLATAGAARAGQCFVVPDQWDEVWDMIIVGSGFAGLAAAYEANRRGIKRILVLEKMEAYGGNSALCGALLCMPRTKMQKALGIQDSPERMVRDMLAAGRGFNHEDLARTLAEGAAGVFDMLLDCGVEFQDKVIRLGGHSAPRAHLPKVPSGGSIVVPMHRTMRGRGVEFRNRSCVEEIVCGDAGATGVIVRADYDWRTGKGGRAMALKARRGIVVATGGWARTRSSSARRCPPTRIWSARPSRDRPPP